MASNKDLEISSMSYVNKDFASIYTDMLDLAKKITNRWDPSQSNESDPGVVLLKEAAFVADHNNYNIDKNILENFLPSATQDKSVRNICEMNGYTPRYYVAATGEVVLYYTFSDTDKRKSFNVPRFTYVISNEDETVSYTQLTDMQIIADENSNSSIQTTCQFIEGTLQTLLINDSSTITMENLDDNNRVYLPEVMVAQNGIFVKNVNNEDYNDYWERDNYLLTQPIGSRKFKLDYDSDMMLPYLEFPSDISNLIGDGLIVQYISTSGEAGNVSAGTLTKIISPTQVDITDQADGSVLSVMSSNFELNNLGSISNGKNPETINEMYQSFKKTVGTFETLISCLDYSNYIFNMEDGNGNPLVSNVYVTDRRTDYNKACNVVTFDDDGIYFKNISIKPCKLSFKGIINDLPPSADIGDMYVLNTTNPALYVYTNSGFVHADTINLNDFALLSAAMTPYDIVIYALKTFAISDYNRREPSYAFKESFKPIASSTQGAITTGIDDTKCISHTFKSADQDDVYCFKNYEPLKIVITPYNVIETKTEGDDIINNVTIAISKNFNPRHLNFGEDLNLSDVKKVIIDCDDRIKDVDITKLYETNILDFTKAMNILGENRDITTTVGGSSILVDLVAKNVLAGRVCLFNFDNSFNITYGQSDGKIIKNISTITTELPIKVKQSENQSSSTENWTSQTYVYESNGEDLWYVFDAPMYTDINGQRINLSISSKKCILNVSSDKKTYDKLTLYRKSEQSENIEEVTYTSQDNVEVEVEVGFENDNYYLLNEKRKIPKELSDDFLVPIGWIRITVKTPNSSTLSGSTNVDYPLKDNESVQIIYPNYYSDKSYGMYVNYRFISNTGNVIRANTEHLLKSNEKIVFVYTTDGVEKQDVYGVGSTINSSFDLQVTDDISSSGVKKDWTDNNGFLHTNDKFRTLASNQSISTRKSMTTELSSSNIKCYWIMNNNNNIIPWEDNEYILGDNEYFIYTNNTFSEMMILGAGTLLKKHKDDPNGEWSVENNTTIESITENGVSSNIPWQSMNFTNAPLTIIEMNVITLGSGDSITITSWDDLVVDSEGNIEPINNEWKFCNGNITYTIGSADKTVLPKVDNFYRIRSRLNLLIGPGRSQELQLDTNNISVQKVKVGEDEITAPYKLQCSNTISTIGGENINLSDSVSIYRYRDDLEEVSNTSLLLSSDSEGIYPFFFDREIGTYLIPVYVSGDNEGVDGAEIKAEIYSLNENDEKVPVEFEDYNNDDSRTSKSEPLILKGNTLYLLTPIGSIQTGELYLKLSGWDTSSSFIEEVSIIVSEFKIAKNDSSFNTLLNELISVNSISLDDVLNRMKNIVDGSDHPSLKPYYIYEPDNTTKINLERYCNKIVTNGVTTYKNKAFDNQEIMWDINNIANQMTIPQIDLDSSNIEINSILRGY